MAIFLVLALLTASCQRSSTDPIARYFAAVSDASAREDASVGRLLEELQRRQMGVGDQEKIRLWVDYLGRIEALISPLPERLAAVTPPAFIRGDHEEFVSAAEGADSALSSAVNSLRRATSIPEAEQILTSLLPAFGRWDAACQRLTKIADSHNIKSKLGCPLIISPALASVNSPRALFWRLGISEDEPLSRGVQPILQAAEVP